MSIAMIMNLLSFICPNYMNKLFNIGKKKKKKEIATILLSHLKTFNRNSLITPNIKCLRLVLINAVFK